MGLYLPFDFSWNIVLLSGVAFNIKILQVLNCIFLNSNIFIFLVCVLFLLLLMLISTLLPLLVNKLIVPDGVLKFLLPCLKFVSLLVAYDKTRNFCSQSINHCVFFSDQGGHVFYNVFISFAGSFYPNQFLQFFFLMEMSQILLYMNILNLNNDNKIYLCN